MDKVLVTGASGFVGSHVLEALQSMNVSTVAVVREPSRLPKGFAGEVRIGDIRDSDFIKKILTEVDSVCACAAWTSAWGHEAESRKYLLEPTLSFIETATRAGVSRIVFPSSTTIKVLRAMTGNGSRVGADEIWPHMANVAQIEDLMKSLGTQRTSMVSLRLGLFAGKRYGLGMLPILLPRLRSHLVPWVGKGRTTLPLVSGRDIGKAIALAATAENLPAYSELEVVGLETPTVREVFRFLHDAYGYPMPHFGVSFSMAYKFARLMERVSGITPWDPFITRSIVLLLEETAASNDAAKQLLGYEPQIHWKDAVRELIAEMQKNKISGLPMARPVPAQLEGARA